MDQETLRRIWEILMDAEAYDLANRVSVFMTECEVELAKNRHAPSREAALYKARRVRGTNPAMRDTNPAN